MSSWKDKLNGDPVPWLLENDRTQPAIRCHALRDILGRDENDSEVKATKEVIMASGPVPVILAVQQPEGYWDKTFLDLNSAGRNGRSASCRSSVRTELTRGIRSGCEYLLSHCVACNGGLSWSGRPSSVAYCGSGVLGAALMDFGWLSDQKT